jgi:PAS domain S-box-containing protein
MQGWHEFLAFISVTYGNMDRERYQVAHSFNIASQEMQELNNKLIEERDKFATMFRSAPIGVAIGGTDGRLLEVNPALVDMLGFSREEIVGEHVSRFVDSADALANFAALAAGRISTARARRHLLSKTGTLLTADIQATGVRDADGRIRMVLTLIDNATERDRLEVELRHSQKLESVGRLASGIAHEINTPIQFVGNNVDFLSEAFKELLSLCETYASLCRKARQNPLLPEDIVQLEQAEKRADVVYLRENIPSSIASTLDGVARVTRIVQSMKAFAHPDKGERTSADINAALRNTLTVATNELKYVAKVETEYGDIPVLPCFLSDLNQVFLNLLVNAAHAIGDVVGQSGQRGTIRLRTYEEGGCVVVAISDTGTGIPPAVQGRIFEPFFTTKGVGKGTGQGLALAHSVVVEQHGGTISFDTQVGKGTTFYVRIPLEPPGETHRTIERSA